MQAAISHGECCKLELPSLCSSKEVIPLGEVKLGDTLPESSKACLGIESKCRRDI